MSTVRIIDLDDNTETMCTLDEFLNVNELYAEERDALCSGERVTFGGGAAPWVAVEVVAS